MPDKSWALYRPATKVTLRAIATVKELHENPLLEEPGIAGTRRDALTREVGHLLDRFLDQPSEALQMDEVTAEVFAIMRRQWLRMPANLVLLPRTLAMSESVGRHLDPDFNVTTAAAPCVKRAVQRRLRPEAWEAELRRMAIELIRLGLDGSGGMRQLMRQLDRGEPMVPIRG